jgi:zinc transporter 2
MRQTSGSLEEVEERERKQSLAMQAAMAHVIGDILQSLGVILAGALIYLKPFDVGVTEEGVSKWNYADPACTFLFSILVMWSTWSTGKQVFFSLMLASPAAMSDGRLHHLLETIPHVLSVHMSKCISCAS